MPRDFEAHRPRLRALAYRMLGSRSEAEDVVQDAWLRWQAADQAQVQDPLAESLLTVFSWGTLPRKSSGCKAQTAAGLVARRGFATPQTLLLRGNPSGKAANRHARCCPPCPGRQHGLRQAPRSWRLAALRTS